MAVCRPLFNPDVLLVHGVELGPVAVAVYTALALHSSPACGESWPSVRRLAQLLGITPRAVYLALTALEKRRLICRRSGRGRGHMTVYTLLGRDGDRLQSPSARTGEKMNPSSPISGGMVNGGSPFRGRRVNQPSPYRPEKVKYARDVEEEIEMRSEGRSARARATSPSSSSGREIDFPRLADIHRRRTATPARPDGDPPPIATGPEVQRLRSVAAEQIPPPSADEIAAAWEILLSEPWALSDREARWVWRNFHIHFPRLLGRARQAAARRQQIKAPEAPALPEIDLAMTIGGLTASALWRTATQGLREEIDAESFETWITPMHVHGIDRATGRLILTAPNDFQRTWLLVNYRLLLAARLRAIVGAEVDFAVITEPETQEVTTPR